MNFSRYTSSYPTARRPTMAANVVSTSQPLAAQAGLRMLLEGGNAVDAALGAAIALTVVEPIRTASARTPSRSCGTATSSTASTPRAARPRRGRRDVLRRGSRTCPSRGWNSVYGAGRVAAWAELRARFGKLPFETLFEPAIDYAENGWTWSRRRRGAGARHSSSIPRRASGPSSRAGSRPSRRRGVRRARATSRRCRTTARTLRQIADSGGESFYKGELAERIAAFAAETGGYITRDDLAAHCSTWVEPIGAGYRGYDV